jgi:hypothetical protein
MLGSKLMEKADAAIVGNLEAEGCAPGGPADRIVMIPVDGSACSDEALKMAMSTMLQ